MMNKRILGVGLVLVAVLLPAAMLFSAAQAPQAPPRDAVYVGAGTCAACHAYQHNHWQRTAHARSYAALADPAAREIAEWSGVPFHPQQSPICLGCHATGAEAEPWEMDWTFHRQQGLQCETCHGPGSEHVDAHQMGDPQASQRFSLRRPQPDDCYRCHQSKGTHDQVLDRAEFDPQRAWQAIAHPTPEGNVPAAPRALPSPARPQDPQHTGSLACGECHQGPEFGYQFERWQQSAHARAYAVLSTPEAQTIARQMGVAGDPQRQADCLRCHSTADHDPAGGFLESFDRTEGVGCEACHGAGSRYSPEAVMRDPVAARAAGLREVTRQTCMYCHDNPHDQPDPEPFDYPSAVAAIAHPSEPPPLPERPQYKTPLNLALRPDARELYVVCEAADSVIVVDVAERRKIAEIPVGRQPIDVAFHPDGHEAYVTNWLEDSVSVIDVARRQVVARIAVGDEPRGLLTDARGEHLYVLNTSTDDVSVIDLETRVETKRLATCRGPWSLALSPDGHRLLATNHLSRLVEPLTSSMSEITVMDTDRAVVEDRWVVPDANLLLGIAWHPSGEFALATLARTKNLVPMTRLMQNWTITNGLGILWADGRVDQVLLDEPMLAFPDPTSLAFTPDGRWALVTSATSDRVAVIDVAKLRKIVSQASEDERERILPNHLGRAVEFVVRHVPTERSPRGIVVTPDGRTAFVANALDDSLTVIELEDFQPVERIDLGGPEESTATRRGERLFHSADITFRRQFSCHTCHPGGHIDGLVYDIEADGIGTDHVDNRTLRGILDTAPFKWSGINPSLPRQCGARLSVFFTRIQPFTPEELEDLERYICTIPRPPNRYRPLGAELNDAQRRGRALFYRTETNDGTPIPRRDQCVNCHPPPYFTDRQLHDVGTQGPLDTIRKFDTPHLNNIYDSPPYLHDGRSATLEEIWTVHNPDDTHGITNDMTKDQLNDLIEYLKTL